jgi:hypothetical protein
MDADAKARVALLVLRLVAIMIIRLCKVLIANWVLAATLLTPIRAFAQTKDAPGKTAPVRGPTEKAIAAAKARGLVWVPKNTRVYYKDGDLYGKGEGEFMPETEAQKAGNREAAGKK